MTRFRFQALTSMAILLVAAVLAPRRTQAADPPRLTPEMDPLVQHLDPSVKPSDDFFSYANGTWLKQHPIPPSERGWSIGNEVEEEIYHQLRSICEASAASGAPFGSREQKVGDFWSTAMDTVAIEHAGIEPIRPELERVATISTREELLETIARFRVFGPRPLYGMWIGQDDKQSDRYAIFLVQGGLGLPDRDYYFQDDEDTKRIREEYPKHIAAMFRLLGRDEASARQAAEAIVRLETEMARRSRTMEERRDPYANYNKMSFDQLDRLTPSIDWEAQFRALGVPMQDSIIVGQPEFFTQIDSLVRTVPLETWREYLRWSLVNTFADRLSRDFDQQDFRFYGTLMAGTPEQRPRWKRALDAEEGAIGELMGQVWSARYCSPATKARYERLVDDIFAAYRDRIGRLDWMDPRTKEKAIAKLARVDRKVGYPDHWRDFSTLQLNRDSYAANQMKVNEWWFRYRVGKLGGPVDRTEWDMSPQTYNAYYDGSKVEIVLPAAAFLIPGVPDSLLDDAILYSYAGASTIGHEITHGFDDEGRRYDANGNLHPWWTVQDSVQFTARAKKLVDQFDQYVVAGKQVRGLATLGENIADLGGIVIAYEAFQKTEQYKKGEMLNGLTPDQRFFLGYALAWLGQYRPEMVAQLIMTDPHSPMFLRVNGPLANVPEFYRAFDVKDGDPMFRPESLRVGIW